MNNPAKQDDSNSSKFLENTQKYIVMYLGNQLFGMQVDKIEDILSPQQIAPIPLSPPEVVGSLNLRGRVVTAIDLRISLDIKSDEKEKKEHRNIVVENKGDLYSFIVDSVAEVIDIPGDKIASNPENLSEAWKQVCGGVFSMEKELMAILDLEKLLKFIGCDEKEEVEMES